MSTNPFVGPQPLSGDHPVFGRERELRELQYLLTSERIVLLYSASGAGKSSMVSGKGGLRERLSKRFDVWPVTRVSTEAPFAVANRWVWSAINGFEDIKENEAAAAWSLQEYAARRVLQDRYPLLIFDQFEEILRLDPKDTNHEKYSFFAQTGELLRDSRFWALFVMREDFIAQCDQYLRMLPTHLQNRYRLSILHKSNARTAIEKTAGCGGRTFTEAALNKLVDDLAAGTGLVEPVQLQVACHDLCEKVLAGAPPIEVAVIEELGDVTKALRLFYDNNVTDIVKKTGVSEHRLREWCERALIVHETIRNQILYDKDAPDALPESAVEALEKCCIVRKEDLRGLDRYELSHDRLIRPIQRSNADWWNKQSPLLLAAKGWEKSKFSPSYLYTGEQLKEVTASTEGKELDPLVRRFLTACESAEEDQRKAERSAEELKRWVAAMGVLVGIVVGPTIVTMGELRRLMKDEQWANFLGRILFLSVSGAVVARALFYLFQFRSDRAEMLRKITRKFRLDPSLDALASHSPAGQASVAAPDDAQRLPLKSLDPERLRTLQFAVLWVFLLTGSQDGVFQTSELRALRLWLRKAAHSKQRSSPVFRSLSREWNRWLEEFFSDERSARAGLTEAAALLATIETKQAVLIRQQLLAIARTILRCSHLQFSNKLDEGSERLLSSLESILVGNDVPLTGKRTKYYQHSKVFSDIDALMAAAKGSAAGSALAIGYALVQEFIPLFDDLLFLFMLFCKFTLVLLFAGFIGSATERYLKDVRSPRADFFVRIVVATAAVYSVLLLFGMVPPFGISLLPVTEDTAINLFGLPVLWVMIIWNGRGRVKGAFCEACGVWCEEQFLGVVAAVPLPSIRPKLEAGDLGALTGLEVYNTRLPGWKERVRSSTDTGYLVDWLRVTIYECPKCRKFCALSVTEVRLGRTYWRGRIRTTFGIPDASDLNKIDRLLITAAQRDVLKAHFASAQPEPVKDG